MGYVTRTYKIEVEVSGGKPTPVLTYEGKVVPKDDMLIFNKNADKMKKVDHYRLRFTIKDFSKSSLRFIPNQTDVMWAQVGTTCPTSACSLPAVFWVDDMDNGGKWIDIINMDMTPEDFWFTLNFCDKSVTNPTPSDYVPLDPGGGNQNTGLKGSGTQITTAAMTTGIATGAITGIATSVFANEAFVAQTSVLAAVVGAAIGLAVGFVVSRM
jgi:hypothetical protein